MNTQFYVYVNKTMHNLHIIVNQPFNVKYFDVLLLVFAKSFGFFGNFDIL